jgi:hypothetical protein
MKDPIRFNGGDTNFYIYVGNNPINSTDSGGTGPVDVLECLLNGGSFAQCYYEERERFSHGPLGDGKNGDGLGGTIFPPTDPPGGPQDPANDNGTPPSPDACGGSSSGPPGPKAKGICTLRLSLTTAQGYRCLYFCPQDGSVVPLNLPFPCPATIGFTSGK